MAIIKATDNTFEKEVIEASKQHPVLVDFWATWCGPCVKLAPIIEQIANEKEGSLTVAKLDVDANPHMAQHYGVMSIPTMILFKDGKKVTQFVGLMPKEAINAKLQPFLSATPSAS